MTTHATTWWGVLSSAVSALSIGYAVVPNASGRFVVATAANRASFGRAWGVAITAASDQNPSFEYQVASVLSADDSDIGTGTAGDWVIVAADGSLERKATPTAGDDVIGRCPHTTGDVQIMPGVWDSENTSPGGGATTPTGTGFPHVTAGVQDAAAKLVENADVHASAAIAASKVVQATGTGFPRVTAGVLDAASVGETGTGNVVRATSPTLVSPTLGAASATSIATTNLTMSATTMHASSSGYYTYNSAALTASQGTWRLPYAQDTIFLATRNAAADGDLYAIRLTSGTAYFGYSGSTTALFPTTSVAGTTLKLFGGSGLNTELRLTSTGINYLGTHAEVTGNARYQPTSDIASVQTTDATVTTLFSFTPTDEAVTVLTVEALAVRSTGAEVNGYIRRVKIKRDGGTVTLGSVVDVWTDEETAAWDCTVDLSGTTVRVRVTGENAKTIDWGCTATRQVMTHA